MTALRMTGAVLLLSMGASGVIAAGAQDFEAQAQVNAPLRHSVLYNSESVLGKELIASGRNAGRIVDVLTDESGRVRAAVVDYGGFLGLGSRKVAVAWSELHFPSGYRNAVTTEISSERLSNAPEVKEGKPVVVISGRDQPAENGVTQN